MSDCGCTASSQSNVSAANAAAPTQNCGNTPNEVMEARNRLVNIQALVTDPAEKQKHNDAIAELEEMLRNSVTPCPDASKVALLSNYATNEHTKYS